MVKKKSNRVLIVAAGVCLVVLAAMAFDTKIVKIGSDLDERAQAFSPDSFGQAEFPRIRKIVNERSKDAATLAGEIATNKKAAIAKYGTMAGAFPVFPVAFEGIVGKGASGVYNIEVAGLPEGMSIRVQTGPAINGTELRDIPGDIIFGDFTNQIEYQDAGAGINRAMQSEIFTELDRDVLTGKAVDVVGVFTMINPKSWLVTPVEFKIQ